MHTKKIPWSRASSHKSEFNRIDPRRQHSHTRLGSSTKQGSSGFGENGPRVLITNFWNSPDKYRPFRPSLRWSWISFETGRLHLQGVKAVESRATSVQQKAYRCEGLSYPQVTWVRSFNAEKSRIKVEHDLAALVSVSCNLRLFYQLTCTMSCEIPSTHARMAACNHRQW